MYPWSVPWMSATFEPTARPLMLSVELNTARRRYGPATLNWKLPFGVTVMSVDVPLIEKPLERPTDRG